MRAISRAPGTYFWRVQCAPWLPSFTKIYCTFPLACVIILAVTSSGYLLLCLLCSTVFTLLLLLLMIGVVITVTVKLTSCLMLVSARCADQYRLCYCVYSALIIIIISDWYSNHCHCKLMLCVLLFVHAVSDSTATCAVLSLLLSLPCPLGLNIIGVASTAWCRHMLLCYPSLTLPRWFSRDPPESPRHPPATGSVLNGAGPRYLHQALSRLRERSRGLNAIA